MKWFIYLSRMCWASKMHSLFLLCKLPISIPISIWLIKICPSELWNLMHGALARFAFVSYQMIPNVLWKCILNLHIHAMCELAIWAIYTNVLIIYLHMYMQISSVCVIATNNRLAQRIPAEIFMFVEFYSTQQ